MDSHKQPQAVEPAVEARRRVLFVDDEQRVLDALKRSLRGKRREWEMTFTNSVAEALAAMDRVLPDAVISDINMPERDGFDLLGTVRGAEVTRDIPVVILTGNGDRDLKRRALDAGATDLLNKPIDADDLVARIGSVLRLKAYQDEIKRHSAQLEAKVRERTAELELSRAEFIWRLGKAGEFRDSDTGNHVVRVGYYAQRLAQQLGLDALVTQTIFLTAPLHDIGKIGVPDRILLKPTKLTPEEWGIMQLHTTIGGQILRAEPVAGEHRQIISQLVETPDLLDHNPLASAGAQIADGHHEHWDGSGYPDGLAGEDIPIPARIVAVSDVYDALCAERPYKPALPEDDVLAIMRKNALEHFDPEVFAAFEKVRNDFREIGEEFRDDPPGQEPADGAGIWAAYSIQLLARCARPEGDPR